MQRGPGPSPMQPKIFRPKGEATLPVMYEYDVEYADRCDLWLDVRILVRTLPAVLQGTGAG